MKEYIVLLCDEAQSLQDKIEKGLRGFGSGAYFVNKEWYEKNVPKTKPRNKGHFFFCKYVS